MVIGQMSGQGWIQFGELILAFLLSALIGIEREVRHKSAGLRTYTLVGVSAALIMLISKYGFTNILVPDRVVLDPSRIAAQIVTGIGFIGGGLIFVRRDSVRGLTTAAIVWLTAAVGMACGAGLPVLALTVTGIHFIVVLGFPYVALWLPRSRWAPSHLQISYHDDGDILSNVLIACTQFEFAVSRLNVQKTVQDASLLPLGESDIDPVEQPDRQASTDRHGADLLGEGMNAETTIATATLELQGTRSLTKLAAKLAQIQGVISVKAGDVNVVTD